MASEIRSLTGIRGLAACWVIAHHIYGAVNLHGPLKTLLAHGYMAVDLFFILSGFVMALSYGNFAYNGWTLKAYGTFLARRFARVYPLYGLITIIVTLMIVAGLAPSTEPLDTTIAMNYTLAQTWGFGFKTLDGPAWSVSTEVAAYILFPVLTNVLTARRFVFPIITAIICLGCIAVLCFIPTPAAIIREGPLDIFWPETPWPLMRCLSEFTLGLIAYRIWMTPATREWITQKWVVYVVTFVLFVLLLFPNSDAGSVTLMPVFLLALTGKGNLVSGLMESRIVFFLGEISYALYLLHMPFILIMQYGLRRMSAYRQSGDSFTLHAGFVFLHVLMFSLFCAFLVFFSWAAYYYIEKPCRNWLRQQWSPSLSG